MQTTTMDIRSTCRIIQGLSREQLDLCYKANDVTIAALDGLDLAMRECQLQVIKYTHLVFLTPQFHSNLNAEPKTFATHIEKRLQNDFGVMRIYN